LEAISTAVCQAHTARTLAPAQPSSALTYRWNSPESPDLPLHACALAMEALLVSPDLRRVRKCGAADCEVYFLDTSKAHRRLWCQMDNCGNREKQRRRRKGK
jgi:predicted RNA-binding Zn ribbon-like protein